MKTVVVCEEDPSYAAALAHLLYVGIATLALTQKQFKEVAVKVIGKTDGWSPFCMKFFGECSYYDEFKPVDDKSNVLYVLSYSRCQDAELIASGLQKFATSVLALPLLESVASTSNYDLTKIDERLITNALVPAGEVEKHKADFGSMEEEQVFLADCVYCVLEVLQKVVATV
jgi:hypothetical protein